MSTTNKSTLFAAMLLTTSIAGCAGTQTKPIAAPCQKPPKPPTAAMLPELPEPSYFLRQWRIDLNSDMSKPTD